MLRGDRERLGRTEHRYVDVQRVELVRPQGIEARVLECGAVGVDGNVSGEGPPGPRAPDAAAQMATTMKSDERRAGRREGARHVDGLRGKRRTVGEAVPHRGDRKVEQGLAMFGEQGVERRGEGGVGHPTTQAPYPTTSPRGPAVSPELRRSMVRAARARARATLQQPGDRRCGRRRRRSRAAAGQRLDGARRLGVAAARRLVVVVVAEVGRSPAACRPVHRASITSATSCRRRGPRSAARARTRPARSAGRAGEPPGSARRECAASSP